MARTNAKTSHSPEKETGKATGPQTQQRPTPTPVPARNTLLTQEQIARRAYEIFMARGGQPGSAEQDWFQAERELRLGRQ
jgi:hypothetical protein